MFIFKMCCNSLKNELFRCRTCVFTKKQFCCQECTEFFGDIERLVLIQVRLLRGLPELLTLVRCFPSTIYTEVNYQFFFAAFFKLILLYIIILQDLHISAPLLQRSKRLELSQSLTIVSLQLCVGSEKCRN